jgi:hypothetical protein
LRFKTSAFGLYEQAGHGEKSTGLIGAQAGEVVALNRDGGRGIKPPRRLIVVVVGQIGAHEDECLRPSPQPPQHT